MRTFFVSLGLVALLLLPLVLVREPERLEIWLPLSASIALMIYLVIGKMVVCWLLGKAIHESGSEPSQEKKSGTPEKPDFAAITQRSTRNNERLTSQETDYLAQANLSGAISCPDCGGQLYDGPEGCGSKNMACLCGSEFNLTGIYGFFHGERISDAGPRDLGDRGPFCYGLPATATKNPSGV